MKKEQLGSLYKAFQRLFISGHPEYRKAIEAQKGIIFYNSSQVSHDMDFWENSYHQITT